MYSASAYQAPSNFGYYFAGGVFYVFLILFLFFSISTAWILIKHGKSRTLTIAMSAAYLFIFFSLAAQGIYILSTLKF